MPAIDRHAIDLASSSWSGQCPASGCGHTFDVEADPWQGRISVLSELTGFPRPEGSHLHGQYVVFDDLDRGGE